MGLVGDRFPDELCDVEDEIGLPLLAVSWRTDLADTDADGNVESPVLLRVAQMKDGADDLSTPGRVRAPIPVPLANRLRTRVVIWAKSLTMAPSEYFKKHCIVSVEPDEHIARGR